MTYRTLLAVVPALALLFAIGRGFGIQDVLQDELFHLFPAQRMAIKYAIGFVDTYMQQTSEGIFLGVGIVFLLPRRSSPCWATSKIHSTSYGGRKPAAAYGEKISDYTATLLILPVLMICASGISLLLSSTLRDIFHFSFMTPVITGLPRRGKCVMTFLFFTAVYMLIPNTKVKFKYAFISGCIAGTAFMVLQWLFLTGTLLRNTLQRHLRLHRIPAPPPAVDAAGVDDMPGRRSDMLLLAERIRIQPRPRGNDNIAKLPRQG